MGFYTPNGSLEYLTVQRRQRSPIPQDHPTLDFLPASTFIPSIQLDVWKSNSPAPSKYSVLTGIRIHIYDSTQSRGFKLTSTFPIMTLLLLVMAGLKALKITLLEIPKRIQNNFKVVKKNIAIKEWERVPGDYLEVLELNRRFILGELYWTPYDFTPLDESTHPLHAQLLKFHDFGFLTIHVQPFLEADRPIQDDNRHGSFSDPIPDAFSQCRQRAYVEFFLPTAHVDTQHYQRFISGLEGRDEIYTTHFQPEDTETKRGNIPRDTHPVTTIRQAPKVNQVKYAKWKGTTWVNSKPNAEWPTMDICNFNDKVAAG